MYCKFCGNRITLNTTKCISCGSAINFRDGGQSFFDDNELEAWRNDNPVSENNTNMPKTEELHENLIDFSAKRRGVTNKKKNSGIPTLYKAILCGVLSISVIIGIWIVIFNITNKPDVYLYNEFKANKLVYVEIEDDTGNSRRIKGYEIQDEDGNYKTYVNFYDIIRKPLNSEDTLRDFWGNTYTDFKEEGGEYTFVSIDNKQKEIVVKPNKKDATFEIDGKEITANVCLVKATEDSETPIIYVSVEFIENSKYRYNIADKEKG